MKNPSKAVPPLALGTFPTPLTRLEPRSGSVAGSLWLKNDGVSAPTYGGNKVRKLGAVLALALDQQKERVITFGAAGSHHVLATTLFAREVGLRTAAILTPQPFTTHAERTLRAAIGAGLEVVPVSSAGGVPFALAKLRSRTDFVLGPGAMGGVGAARYAAAVTELVHQFAEQGERFPERLVVAVGSGGTAGGILAGVCVHGLDCTVVGVAAAAGVISGPLVLAQAMLALRHTGQSVSRARLERSFELDRTQVGAGYGHPGPAYEAAERVAATHGLGLEPTYTGKAFSVALALAGDGEFQTGRNDKLVAGFRTLYWHTLSAVPLDPLLESAPPLGELPASVRQLLVPPPPMPHRF
jgi:D-cysteine desulfhydrase